jgi:processive 1,2-diacylglycerol beta-glucosyltransferase
MKKRILILTASFGEGHNSAARGVRDGLARVAPEGTEVELRDLFAEAYGPVNELVRKSYLAVVNFAPRAWGAVYRWLDRKRDFDTEFARFSRLEEHFSALLERFQRTQANSGTKLQMLTAFQNCRCSHGFNYY